MIFLLTLLQLTWLSLTSAFLLFWLIYLGYLRLSATVKKLHKKRHKKLRNLARFWLRRALALMLSNAMLAFIIMLIQ